LCQQPIHLAPTQRPRQTHPFFGKADLSRRVDPNLLFPEQVFVKPFDAAKARFTEAEDKPFPLREIAKPMTSSAVASRDERNTSFSK
jgi:hypothetical protein